jgi:hypothetical protein
MMKKHKSLLLRFDRILAQDLLRQVVILVAVLFVIFLVSFILLSLSGNDWQAYCRDDHISKWVFPLYLLIDGNAFHDFCSSDVSGLAVFFACLIYIIGVVIFTGMIISVMTNMIERRVENHREGRINYMVSGHYVIMGYDDMVPSFIKHIFGTDKDAYVLLLTSAKVLDVTEKLRKSFNEEQMKHIIINYGHRTTAESYKDIHLESAEEIFIVGYHSNPTHDAINVECVDCICRYLKAQDCKQKPKKITCVFKDLDTYAAFKTSEIFGKVGELGVEFIPYNFFTGWAKQVFVKRFHLDMDNPKVKIIYPAVFGNGIGPDDDKNVHLVFVGTTNFAVAFAMEAAHVFHFPNFNNKGKKTRITFIDLNADKEKDEFITRNRHFFEIQPYYYKDLTGKAVSANAKEESIKDLTSHMDSDTNFLDVEFEFIKGDIFSKNVQDEISKWAKDKDGQYLSIFLAMENQRSNFVMGMNMPDEVYDYDIPVFIRQDRSDNFVTNLRTADDKEVSYHKIVDGIVKPFKRKARYANIYPFGMNETAYSADNKSVKRAKLINYLYCTADYSSYKFQGMIVLDAIPEEKIWEDAEKMWQGLSVALKWSNLYNSYTIRTKLATLRAMRGLKLEDTSKDTMMLSDKEVEEMAKVEHNRWNVEKLLMGFRKSHLDEDKYEAPNSEAEGKLAKNKNLYIHSDIRPFDKLGTIRELDYEFSRYIPWIMKMTEKCD